MTSTANTQHQPQHVVCSRSRLRWTDRIWLASISIADGLPIAMLFLLAVMFKRFSLNNSTVTFNISCACLPWLARPLCHLLLKKTGWSKDVWLLATELTIALSLLLISEALDNDMWFQLSMLLLLVITTASVIHGVVAESLYRDITSNAYPPVLRPMYVAYHAAALLFGVGFLVMLAGNIEVVTRHMVTAWVVTLRVAAAACAVLWAYNLLMVWRRAGEKEQEAAASDIDNVDTWHELGCAMRLFFGKRTVSIGALFVFCYLLPQGFTLCVSSLFLIDTGSRGGLGLSPQEYAFVAGTIGVMGLAAGCLLCIRLLKHSAIHRIVVPVSFAGCVPALAGVVISRMMPMSLTGVNVLMFISHASLGMAAMSCISFLAYYSCGKYKPTFFSIGISLICMSLFLSMLYSGSMQRYYGYRTYFLLASVASLLPVAAAVMLKRLCFRRVG